MSLEGNFGTFVKVIFGDKQQNVRVKIDKSYRKYHTSIENGYVTFWVDGTSSPPCSLSSYVAKTIYLAEGKEFGKQKIKTSFLTCFHLVISLLKNKEIYSLQTQQLQE